MSIPLIPTFKIGDATGFVLAAADASSFGFVTVFAAGLQQVDGSYHIEYLLYY